MPEDKQDDFFNRLKEDIKKGVKGDSKKKKNNDKSVNDNVKNNDNKNVNNSVNRNVNKTVNGNSEKAVITEEKGVNKTVNNSLKNIVNDNDFEDYFKSENDPEKKLCGFRLFKKQYKKIKWLADAYDMGVSEFMRKAVSLIIEIYTEKLRDLEE